MTSNSEKEPTFELSREVSSHYFKSSFARSMFSNSNQSKSLDFVYFDNGTIDEENENDLKTPTDDIGLNFTGKPFTSPLKRGYTTKYDHKYEPDFLKTSPPRNQNNNAITFWKRKQEEATLPKPRKSENQSEEIVSLKKECQRLSEENQRLSQTMDQSHLQTQVETLQWQLKQAESSRHMYRAVLEQVSKFLERVHKNLDQVNGKPPPSKCKARSRSVHTVSCQSHSRPVSPSPSTLTQPSVQRANSISQIQDTISHSYSIFRDFSWRTPRGLVEEVPPEKLSQEAFRLMRTVQSLLGTREPDLSQRLTSSSNSDTESSRDNTWFAGSCSSLLPHLCSTSSSQRKSLDASSCSSRTEAEGEVEGGNPSTPQLSVGSTEDESGFSSMSSFHEVGLPEIRTYPEVGLPLVEPTHRRWSSTPVETQAFRNNSSIQVLWV